MPRTKKKNNYPFKSGLERKAYEQMPSSVTYEDSKLKYTVIHEYRPDFTIRPNVFIETKGRFLSADRAKHLHIKEQHPEVKVYFLFGNSNNTLTKSSKTTYAEWCDKHGFSYSDFYKDGIPEEWFHKNK